MVLRKHDENKLQVAIFPLPGMVAFEGQQHLLHVFEPRYRKMVDDCVENKWMLGLALPRKRISTVDNSGKSFQEILNSNQSTYEAHDVLGAGSVRILRTLPDGRVLVMVNIHHRVRIKDMTQTLPYFLAEVELSDVEPLPRKRVRYYFDQLLAISKSILGEKYRLFEEKIPDIIFQNYDLQALMLKVMDWFRLESDLLQQLLEQPSLEERVSSFLDYMYSYLAQEDPELYESQVPAVNPFPEDGEAPGKLIEVDFTHKRSKDHPDVSDS
ncbi:MAG: LON peptidase substrate-binding domain-containing protein [Oligoflexus sp.]